MNTMKHGRWLAVFTAIILMIAVAGCQTSAPREKEAETPESLSFKLAELNSGKTVDFPADYRGEKVLLTFFGLG